MLDNKLFLPHCYQVIVVNKDRCSNCS